MSIIAGLAVIFVLASPTLWILSQSSGQSGSTALLYAVSTLIALAFAKTMGFLKRGDETDGDLSTSMKGVGLILTVIHYNAVALVGVIIGSAIAGEFTPALGLVGVVAYAFWDEESSAYAIPLSIGGAIVFGVAMGLILQFGGRAVWEYLKRASIKEILGRLKEAGKDALNILDTPETETNRLANKKLKLR